jgi:hypothetical protein
MRLTAPLVAGIVLGQVSAQAATFNVNDLADGVDAAPGNGICATARRTCTLRAAVQETNALAGNDVINLGVGVHELTIAGADEDDSATGDLDITRTLTIRGANAYLSIIDANGIDRVLDQVTTAVNPRILTLEDLTITGGDADLTDGGGLRFASAVDARRIIVTRNHADFGGGGLSAVSGIGIEPGPLELRSSIISLNTGQDGGGVNADASGRGFLIERSIIIANTADLAGGGIVTPAFDGGDRARLDEVAIYGNAVTGPGSPKGGGLTVSFRTDVDQSWIGHNLVGNWGRSFPPPTARAAGRSWEGTTSSPTPRSRAIWRWMGVA